MNPFGLDATGLMVWGLVAHLIADWPLQNDWMANHKALRRERRTTLDGYHGVSTAWYDRHPAAYVHAGIHGALLALVFGWVAAPLAGRAPDHRHPQAGRVVVAAGGAVAARGRVRAAGGPAWARGPAGALRRRARGPLLDGSGVPHRVYRGRGARGLGGVMRAVDVWRAVVECGLGLAGARLAISLFQGWRPLYERYLIAGYLVLSIGVAERIAERWGRGVEQALVVGTLALVLYVLAVFARLHAPQPGDYPDADRCPPNWHK